MTFHFIAGDNLDLSDFEDIETFIDKYSDFQSVDLNSESELKLLFKTIGVLDAPEHELNNSDFVKYWDLSSFKLPELNKNDFDTFYDTWLNTSKRQNNMDEYGNLIFLQGLSSKWNKLRHRLVVMDKINGT